MRLQLDKLMTFQLFGPHFEPSTDPPNCADSGRLAEGRDVEESRIREKGEILDMFWRPI